MGQSRLRPETVDANPGTFAPTGVTAYYSIYGAVKARAGLIHGKLHAHGESCAIGAYFDATKAALNFTIIDEVAAVNDSVPTFTERQRRTHVLRWLRWRLEQLLFLTSGRKPKAVEHA